MVCNGYSSSMLTVLVLSLPHFCQWGWLCRAAHASHRAWSPEYCSWWQAGTAFLLFWFQWQLSHLPWALMDREVGKGISPFPMLNHDRWVMGTILPHSQLQAGSATPLPTGLALLNIFLFSLLEFRHKHASWIYAITCFLASGLYQFPFFSIVSPFKKSAELTYPLKVHLILPHHL